MSKNQCHSQIVQSRRDELEARMQLRNQELLSMSVMKAQKTKSKQHHKEQVLKYEIEKLQVVN